MTTSEESNAKPKTKEDESGHIRRLSALFVVVSSSLSQCLMYGYALGMGVLLSEIIDVLQTSRAQTSLMQTLCLGIMFAGGLVIGPLVHKLGEGSAVILGGIIATVGSLGASFATSVEVLIITAGVISGTGLCFVNIGSIVAVNTALTNRKGYGIGIAVTGGGLGAAIFPLLQTQLIQTYGWRGAFFITSGLNFNLCLFGSIIRVFMEHANTDYAMTIKERASKIKAKSLYTFLHLDVFRNKRFTLYLLIAWPVWFFMNGFIVFLVDSGKNRNLDLQQSSFLLSMMTFAKIFGGILGGVMNTHLPVTLVNSLAIISFALLCLGQAFLYEYAGMLAVVFFMGLTNGIIDSSTITVIGHITDNLSYTFALSYFFGIAGIGNVLSGPVFGAIRDTTGDYTVDFYIIATGLTSLGLLLLVHHAWLAFRHNQEKGYKKTIGTSTEAVVTYM